MKYPQDYINKIINGDCLEVMKGIPDKSIDLVLTDPPYGIGADIKQNESAGKVMSKSGGRWKKYPTTNWDSSIPSEEYFKEMFRVSKNQIIWGGNYFTDYLAPSKCWLMWDKISGLSLPDGELAWSSFNSCIRIYRESRADAYINSIIGIDVKAHPTQKALGLMEWCLENYSKPGMIILDPFNGSGTTTKACKKLNRNFIGIEISEDYCKIARDRLKQQVLPL
jgi:site-specific DNA-methyltransferase (adenine-specific)